jgi:hypothetical protein
MTGFTANSGGDMRLVVEMDEIRLDGDRYPGNGFTAADERCQFIQLG